jgi:hypothetical protein
MPTSTTPSGRTSGRPRSEVSGKRQLLARAIQGRTAEGCSPIFDLVTGGGCGIRTPPEIGRVRKPHARTVRRDWLAEDAGFEPARALTQPAFQASAIGH